MTPREIVRRTLDFENPERVACSFGDSDFVSVRFGGKTHATDWDKLSDSRSWERSDEWGNVWRRVDDTSKGEVAKGALDNLNDLDNYEFPDFSRPEDYDCVRKARQDNPDKWIRAHMTGLSFSVARKLRKLDQYLMDIVLEPELISKLHDRIDVVLEDMIRNHAAAGVDCVMFWEDWGTQQQLLISPDMWIKEFYPRFEKLCGIAHQCGVKVFMHSCGNIAAIVPHLMKAGVDVLQFDQPELHGIDTLASYQQQAKVSFWCPVDIQKTLQTRDESLIRTRVKEMLDKLWKGRGGFIAGWYDDNASIGLEPEWQEYACDEFVKLGVKELYANK